jgi:hypothetical protein
MFNITWLTNPMATKKSKTIKGHCPKCGPHRTALIVKEHYEHWEHEEHGIWLDTYFRVLKCLGCEEVYVQKAQTFSEDIGYDDDDPEKIEFWPAPVKRERPSWHNALRMLDNRLHSLLEETYVAYSADIRTLAAIGLRTTLDCATEKLQIDPAISFEEKLDELVSLGHIGKKNRESLTSLTDAGNAAAHRGWTPKPKELDTMLDILEHFLHHTFILADRATDLKGNVPPKPKRKKP